jgi:hypothetical protein
MSPAADHAAYLIIRNQASVNQIVDTLWGQAQLSWTDSTVNACLGDVSYSVASIDNCQNISAASPAFKPFRMNAEYLPTSATVKLSWQPQHIQFPFADHYTVFMMKNYGLWTEYVSVVAPGNLVYYNFPDLNAIYCFFLRVSNLDGSKTASSCVECVATGPYTGMVQNEQQESLRLYPNPAQNELNIQLPDGIGASFLGIYSPEGRCVMKTELTAGEKEVHLNISSLENGFYLLRLQSDAGVLIIRRLVVSRSE